MEPASPTSFWLITLAGALDAGVRRLASYCAHASMWGGGGGGGGGGEGEEGETVCSDLCVFVCVCVSALYIFPFLATVKKSLPDATYVE